MSATSVATNNCFLAVEIQKSTASAEKYKLEYDSWTIKFFRSIIQINISIS
jgi:hypothetical protein